MAPTVNRWCSASEGNSNASRSRSRSRAISPRAAARGEIARDRDLDLLALLFPSLALHHLLTVGAMPEAGFAQRIMEDVILPLATAPLSDLPSADAST